MKNNLKFFFALLISISLLFSCNNKNEKVNKTEKTTPENNIKYDIVFDIPNIIDKNIDEIIKEIGKPNKTDSEPTKQQIKYGITEWNKTWEKNGYTLLVTYNFKDRKVIDFFIPTNNSNGITKDYSELVKIGNLENKNYTIKPIKALGKENYYTGIRIIP